jgi:hypothetical protein
VAVGAFSTSITSDDVHHMQGFGVGEIQLF